MRSDSGTSGQKGATFIEQARRRQIVDAAVATVAEQGYGAASLAAIARTAGVSKGVISYHFAGKDELMEACVQRVYGDIAERVVPQLAGRSALDLIREHILAVARDGLEHRDELLAVSSIVTHMRTKDGRPRYSLADNEELYRGLELMYAAAEAEGVARSFDHRVMAVSVQASLDAMFAYWAVHPEHDLLAHAEQLADMVVAAVRRTE